MILRKKLLEKCSPTAPNFRLTRLPVTWIMDRVIRLTPSGGKSLGGWVGFRGGVDRLRPYPRCPLCGAWTADIRVRNGGRTEIAGLPVVDLHSRVKAVQQVR